MLAKKTAKNQITLPKAVIKDFPDTEYYDVRCEGDLIVLEPVRLEKRTEGRQSRADKVRERLADLGITEPVSYTHLRAHETDSYLVCRLLLEKKKKTKTQTNNRNNK